MTCTPKEKHQSAVLYYHQEAPEDHGHPAVREAQAFQAEADHQAEAALPEAGNLI